MVATRAGEPSILVIVELKLGFTLDLVLQGVSRLPYADEVWLAVGCDNPARSLYERLGFRGHGTRALYEQPTIAERS